jgi:hypothetical protein
MEGFIACRALPENIFTSCEKPPDEDKLQLANSIERLGGLARRESATLCAERLTEKQQRPLAACEMDAVDVKRVS